MTTITRTTGAARPQAAAKDALALLRADHEAVRGLFAEYERTHLASGRQALAAEICTALRVRAQIEEEVFYPAVKAALKDTLLVPEAAAEHATLERLIAQIEDLRSDGEVCGAEVKVLSEHVKHHVKKERSELFPKVRAAALDLAASGARTAARKAAILAWQD